MPLFDLPGHLPVQAQVRWPAVAQEALPLALVRAHLIAHQQAACRVVVGVFTDRSPQLQWLTEI